MTTFTRDGTARHGSHAFARRSCGEQARLPGSRAGRRLFTADSQESCDASQTIHREWRHCDPMNTITDHPAGRILVVDDEASITDAVATALRYEGFDVQEASNGRDALAAVMSNEPDLIVLDWMLPDISGVDVGRRLRERGFKTAILFLTAKDAVEDKVEALRAG